MKSILIKMVIMGGVSSVAYFAVLKGNEWLGNLLIAWIWSCAIMVSISFLCILFSDEVRESVRDAHAKQSYVGRVFGRMFRICMAVFLIYHGWIFTGVVYSASCILGFLGVCLSKVEIEDSK